MLLLREVDYKLTIRKLFRMCYIFTIHFVRHLNTYYIKMWFSSPLYYNVSIVSRVTRQNRCISQTNRIRHKTFRMFSFLPTALVVHVKQSVGCVWLCLC